MAKNKKFYRSLLPEKLTVEIHTGKDGLWAKVKELPGCYTQADNMAELIGMLNDAIYTYLEIPKKYAQGLGYYMPQPIVDEIKRRHWQNAVRKIVEKASTVEDSKIKKVEIFRLEEIQA